ncbi:VP1 [Bat-associated densovirus 4]|uniref:VP1 n=1 Tax=Bat-associated densovirus 4 TaxID=3070186 RepID=A0A7M1PW40_9VIRU|nr:VP1 [Bat associated densovirus]QOR29556.1 VP1 [Bat-associated densovirus 4]
MDQLGAILGKGARAAASASVRARTASTRLFDPSPIYQGIAGDAIEKEFQRRRAEANKRNNSENYVHHLVEDLENTREKLTKIPNWDQRQVDRLKNRISTIKQHLDYYGVDVETDERDFFTPTPENYQNPSTPGGYHLPGSHYIGPGTDDYSRPTKTVADAVAREHDIAYTNAKSTEDIRSADSRAISGFIDTISKDPVQGSIGALGIGTKYAVESITGVTYGKPSEVSMDTPPPSGQKRTNTSSSTGATEAKRNLTVPINNASGGQPVEETMATGGKPTAYGESGDNEGPLFIGQGHNPSSKTVYTKKFMVETCGMQFEKKPFDNVWAKVKQTADATQYALTTPLATIDPNDVGWYLTPVEFAEMSNMTFAESCEITCRPLGYRIPFATNKSVTENVNSSATLIQICSSTGINHKFDGSMVTITNDTTDPTKASAVTWQGERLQSKLYRDSTAACLGNHTPLHTYYCLSCKTDVVYNNVPHLMKAMTIVNIADVRGDVIQSVNYKFKCAPIKYTLTHKEKYQSYVAGLKDFHPVSTVMESAEGVTNDNAASVLLTNEMFTEGFSYHDGLEKSAYYSMRPGEHNDPIYPPYLSFGVLPLKSSLPGAAAQYLPVVVTWEISTKLYCNTIHDYPYTGTNSPWTCRIFITKPATGGSLANYTDVVKPYNYGGFASYVRPYGANNVRTIGRSTMSKFSAITGNPNN